MAQWASQLMLSLLTQGLAALLSSGEEEWGQWGKTHLVSPFCRELTIKGLSRELAFSRAFSAADRRDQTALLGSGLQFPCTAVCGIVQAGREAGGTLPLVPLPLVPADGTPRGQSLCSAKPFPLLP